MILCSCISLAERSIELIRVPISGGNKAIIFFTSDTSAVIRLHFVSNVRNSDNKTLYTMDAVFSIHKKVVCDSKGDVQTTV